MRYEDRYKTQQSSVQKGYGDSEVKFQLTECRDRGGGMNLDSLIREYQEENRRFAEKVDLLSRSFAETRSPYKR